MGIYYHVFTSFKKSHPSVFWLSPCSRLSVVFFARGLLLNFATAVYCCSIRFLTNVIRSQMTQRHSLSKFEGVKHYSISVKWRFTKEYSKPGNNLTFSWLAWLVFCQLQFRNLPLEKSLVDPKLVLYSCKSRQNLMTFWNLLAEYYLGINLTF